MYGKVKSQTPLYKLTMTGGQAGRRTEITTYKGTSFRSAQK